MPTSIASSTSGLVFSGLASGIDTSTIIEGLTKLNQRRIDELQARKDVAVQKRSIFGSLQAKLLDLQAQAGKLSRSIAGAFDGRKATSSDETVLTAAAGSTALAGTYSLQVQALAQAHQVASSGVTDATTGIKQGTVQIRVGNGATTMVTIDATNNTFQGLANAINAANGDVRATVINDGSATPYRILLSSTKTGAANTIQITNNLTTGTGADIDLAQTIVQAADDARVTIGSGAGAITVTSASNHVDNLIAGVSVTLNKVAAGQTVSLNVTPDVAAARDAVTAFVNSYNAVVDFIGDRSNFDSGTQSAGILLGNHDAAAVLNDLANGINTSVGGVNTNANRLTAIGVSFNETGHLQIDNAKLDQAINGQITGVALSDLRRLFALSGQSTSAGVSFLLGGARTEPSGSTPYQVDITHAATAAQLVGSTPLDDSILIDDSNSDFTIKVNGVTSSVLHLSAGTYTPESLATAVQSLINADSQLGTNSQVAVDLDGGKLRFRSLQVGSLSQVSFVGGSALGATSPLGLLGSESAAGTNVAGNFIVNGQIEAATGFGQTLSGASGNAHTDGLQVRVTLSADQIVAGAEADLTVTQGLASRLDRVLNRFLDPVTGRFKSIDTRYQKDAEDIDSSITTQNNQLTIRKNQLIAQFAAMESTISRIKSLSDQLAAQFSVISLNTSK